MTTHSCGTHVLGGTLVHGPILFYWSSIDTIPESYSEGWLRIRWHHHYYLQVTILATAPLRYPIHIG